MKKSQQIIGLPIISISDGNEVGKVKNIIINSDTGSIDYFVVDSGIQVLSTRVIPTTNVLGIGEYAMTILNPEAINDISKIPAAIDLLQKNITVRQTKVLTKKGSLIGETGDIYVDVVNNCQIAGIEYIADITQKKIRLIPRSCVITFGKTLLVVEDDVESRLLDDPAELSETSADIEQKKNDDEIPLNGLNLNGVTIDREEETAKSGFDLDIPHNHEGAASASEPVQQKAEPAKSTAAELFEKRQRQYLMGRKATKNIADSQGNIIIKTGETITEQVIDRAKGSGKLIELVMNNEA